MTSSLLLVAILAASPHPVTIFVGPMVRDGFVEVDKGVLDSIKDINDELRKNYRTFRLVPAEAGADLRLYVVSRNKIAGTGTPVQIGTGQVVGGVVIGTGATITEPDCRIDALLKIGDYEKALFGQSEDRITGTWNRAAKLLVKDLVIWVTANRERLDQMSNAPAVSSPKPPDSPQ